MYNIIKLIDSNKYIELHDKLNPKLWNGLELKPEIKNKLLNCVDIFVENLKNNDIKITIIDICLVGSNASYNYTNYSDIDIHIIANINDQNNLEKIYDIYRKLFKNLHNIKIKGYTVELYIENYNNPSKSNGIYSLNNGWIKLPKKININIDEENISILFDKYEKEYKKLLKLINNIDLNEAIKKIDNFISDLYKLRKSGLEVNEFDDKNIVFKEFRNKGYLDNLRNIKNNLETKFMSL